MKNLEKKQGKIGIFDSGLGGLTILKEVIRLMPNWEYLYLGDNSRAPYGNKSQEEIFECTLAGVGWLFSHGAEIVVLACNTASANALRKIQQEILPLRYSEKKVLGIIIPTAEEMHKLSKSGHIGVLATKATVASGTFKKEIEKYSRGRGVKVEVSSQSGGRLVEFIEGAGNEKMLDEEIGKVTRRLMAKDEFIDTIILGCTHYALIEEQIKKIVPRKINVINQGGIVAQKLVNYLDRHVEICQKLRSYSAAFFYTTSSDSEVKKKMAQFFGKDISVETVAY